MTKTDQAICANVARVLVNKGSKSLNEGMPKGCRVSVVNYEVGSKEINLRILVDGIQRSFNIIVRPE